MSRIYLTRLPSDVAGYLLALVDERNPNAPAFTTSVTATVGSSDNIPATATSGGTELKWITKPMLADTVIPAQPIFVNTWALESNAAANASVGFRVAEYTTSDVTEQAALKDTNDTAELTTSIANKRVLSTAPSATTIDAGNRIALHMDVVAVGTMGDARTVTIDYDGPTEGADGDTWFDIPVLIRVAESQVGSGSGVVPLVELSKAFYTETIDNLNILTNGLVVAPSATVQDTVDECGFRRDAL